MALSGTPTDFLQVCVPLRGAQAYPTHIFVAFGAHAFVFPEYVVISVRKAVATTKQEKYAQATGLRMMLEHRVSPVARTNQTTVSITAAYATERNACSVDGCTFRPANVTAKFKGQTAYGRLEPVEG